MRTLFEYLASFLWLSLFCHVKVTHSFLNQRCFSHDTCNDGNGTHHFCFKSLNTSRTGQCIDTWACCLFPERFGYCPTQAYIDTCDEYKMYKTVLNDTNNDDAISRLIFNQLYTTLVIGYPLNFIDIINDDIIDTVDAVDMVENVDAIRQWMATQHIQYSDSISSVTDLGRLLNNISYIISPSCEIQRGVGCPCDTEYLPCPASFVCSSLAYRGLTSMMYDDVLLHGLQAICVPCKDGEYCEVDREPRPCPRGFACPNPQSKRLCGVGTYCPEGSTRETNCSFLRSFPSLSIDFRRQSDMSNISNISDISDISNIINTRILDFVKIGSMVGNYCPAGSSQRDTKCPRGYYCPDPSLKIVCPKGSFCGEQSTRPRACPLLSRFQCRTEGRADPGILWTPYVFAIGIVIFILGARFGQSALNVIKRLKCIEQKKNFQINTTLKHTTNNDSISKSSAITPLEEIALVKVSTPWLKESSATFVPNGMNAIIGGSGCGKSTFLDLMRGNFQDSRVVSGFVHVRLRGQDDWVMDLRNISSNKKVFDKMKDIRGFVPQDDVLYGDLTVYENILYSAYLKLQNNMSSNVTSQSVKNTPLHVTEYVMENLGLMYVRDKIVGSVEKRGISGGQRKRCNIGMEIVTLPSLLIMDEPTSGLDAHGCQQLVEYCKVLNTLNMTIIAVVHQPRYSSFELFDNVLLLSRFGTIFEGSPAAALIYFTQAIDKVIDKNENPADVLMDIISTDAEILVPIWESSGKQWIADVDKTYPWSLFKDVLRESVVCTDDTLKYAERLLYFGHTLDLNQDSLIFSDTDADILTHHELACVKRLLENTLNNLSRGSNFEMHHFKEACSQAYLSEKYDNVLDRISLFTKLPQSIIARLNTKPIVLAYKFGCILMKRIGINLNRHRLKTPEELYKLANETNNPHYLMIAMICNALTKRRNLERNTDMSALEVHTHIGHIGVCVSKNIFPRHVKIRTQLAFIFSRKSLMIWRSPWPIQLLIPMVAAFIIGNIHGVQSVDTLTKYPQNIVSAMVCLGVLSMITHVRAFSLDKDVIRRESECKINLFPFFLSYNALDSIWLFMVPMCFMVPYYTLTLPLSNFGSYFAVSVCVCWWTSGLAYIISFLPIAFHWANLIAVFVSIIFGAFLQGLNPTLANATGLEKPLIHFSYNRWAMEILTVNEYAKYDPEHAYNTWSQMDAIGLCQGDEQHTITTLSSSFRNVINIFNLLTKGATAQCDSHIRNAYLWLICYGCVFRIIAIGLFYFYSNPFFRHILNYSFAKIKT